MSAVNAKGDVEIRRGLFLGRMTTTDRNNFGGLLGASQSGVHVWDTTVGATYWWDGAAWRRRDPQVLGPFTRAAAVAMDWSQTQFPVVVRITDYAVGVTPSVGADADVLFLAAPTAAFDGSNEKPVSGYTLDSNGEWADEVTPFPAATHNLCNVAARLSHLSMVANSGSVSGGAGGARQLWLPPQDTLGNFILPAAEVQAGGTLTYQPRMWKLGLCTRVSLAVSGGAGDILGSFDVQIDYAAAGTAFVTNPITVSPGALAPTTSGFIGVYSNGFGGNGGLARANDNLPITVTPVGGSTLAVPLQLNFFGYSFEQTQVRQ